MQHFGTLLFCCAICQRNIWDYHNRNGRDRHLQPVCRMCESTWNESTWNERTGKIHAGQFMDRRKAMQINALSEALRSAAATKQWAGHYASA